MKQLQVAAIENGTVLDHIPPTKLYKVAELLEVSRLETPVTIGNNLQSKTGAKKGVIKLTDKFFSDEEINRIAIVAPHVTLNLIRDFKVVEKRPVELPGEVVGIVRCPNPKCISRNEPMNSFFYVQDVATESLVCKYCGRNVCGNDIELL